MVSSHSNVQVTKGLGIKRGLRPLSLKPLDETPNSLTRSQRPGQMPRPLPRTLYVKWL